MRTRTKWGILLGLVLAISAIVIYNYIYQDHRDIAAEAPRFTLDAKTLSKAFETDEDQATARYLNQTIEIAGVLIAIDGEILMMEPNLFFALSENSQ